MQHDFSGRRALVTGGASGIGAACAAWLAARGIDELVLVDRDGAGMAALDLPCRVRRIEGDVADPVLWERVESEVDRLDHALVNAGVANGGPLVDFDYAEWRRIMAINLDGAFLSLRAALRIMKRGGGRSVVLTSSVVGVTAVAGTGAYGVSKAGLTHLARIAAAEHLEDGIRINAVAPGRVDTPIWTSTDAFALMVEELGSRDAALKALGDQTGPEATFATADELAGQIGFLLSDAARHITGTVLVSDGGYSFHP